MKKFDFAVVFPLDQLKEFEENFVHFVRPDLDKYDPCLHQLVVTDPMTLNGSPLPSLAASGGIRRSFLQRMSEGKPDVSAVVARPRRSVLQRMSEVVRSMFRGTDAKLGFVLVAASNEFYLEKVGHHN